MAMTAARSGVSTYWIASAGTPAFSADLARMCAIMLLEACASLPPRSSTALPALRQRPAASAVTFGRDS